ncbi:hypothetical protein GALL_391550 [mine drainage metagenome]|jgi:hypothetical protein|uniref:Uncharacterized protein n=1 Tax=mine drainage metagenome TaxID=410659 RepID=A0A1J5Q5Y2_9ZZZZ
MHDHDFAPRRQRRLFALSSALLSAALWIAASWLLHRWHPLRSDRVHAADLRGGLRLLLALSLGWPAVFGLGSGSLVNHAAGWSAPLAIQAAVLRAALSAISPFVALRAATPLLHIRADLHGLRAWHLLVLAALGALCWDVPDMMLLAHAGVEAAGAAVLARRLLVNLGATLALIYAGGYAWHFYARRLARDAA